VIQSLQFSVVCQNVSIDNKNICLDEQAALKIERDYHEYEYLDSLSTALINAQDTAIKNRDKQLILFKKDLSICEENNVNLQNTIIINKQEAKRTRFKTYLEGVGAGALIALLLRAVL
jgi:hypothetical protein